MKVFLKLQHGDLFQNPCVSSLDINYWESNKYLLTRNKLDRIYLSFFPTPSDVRMET